MTNNKIPLVGDNYIDFLLFDLGGNEYKLSNYLNKIVLIEFWSRTCMTCMATAPELKKVHEKFGDKINVIGINADEYKEYWQTGTDRDHISWVNLSDLMGNTKGITGAYGVFAYPSFVIINTKGLIIDRWMGFKPGKIEERILEALK